MKKLIIIIFKRKNPKIINKSTVSNDNLLNILLGNLYDKFILDVNEKKKFALKKLISIYSKHLNKIKKTYFLKYRMNVSNMSSYLNTCTHPRLYQKSHAQSNSIPIYNEHFQNNNNYTYSENNISCGKKSSSNINNSHFNKQSFSNNSENQNKSAYSNYVDLNKSQYYFNGNKIGNFTSYKINNYNNSIYINNNNNNKTLNSKDKKYIVQIRLSSNKISNPDIFNNKNYNTIKNNNSFVNKYSNNIENNNKNIINDKKRYRHYSYRNLTIPNKLDYHHIEPRNNYCSFKSYKDIKNIKKEIITEKIFVREKKNSYKINNKINNNNSKLIDEQILDYLSRNINEKEYLIKKMNNQNVVLRKVNKNKIINLNNLNNYSYINNNYNYYCNNNNELNSTLYKSNNMNNINKKILKNSRSSKNKNVHINNGKLNQERYTVSNTIYSNYLKKKMKKIENNRYPVKIDYTNVKPDIDNYFDSEPIIYKKNENTNSTKNYPIKRGSKKIIKIDYYNSNYYYYDDDNDNDNDNDIDNNIDNDIDNDIYNEDNNELSPERYKIPVPNKMTLSKNNILYRRKVRNTTNNIKINSNTNDNYQFYDTDRTSSNNYTLNEYKSLKKKKYKNKIYKNKINKSSINNNNKNKENVIQKGFNLFFSNENDNKMKSNKNILCSNNNFNIDGNNDKKEKGKIMIIKKNIILKKNNSFNSKLKDNKIIKNLKKLQVSHNVINEQFNKDKYLKDEQINTEKEKDDFSVQSLDDSKLMELANNYINDEDLNKQVIKEILNSKKENKEYLNKE